MSPFQGEVCRNGHKRTLENTSMVRDNARNRVRKRCLSCTARTPKKLSKTTENALSRVNNLEDLMDMGTPRVDLPIRAGYPNRRAVLRSLAGLGKLDIAERFRNYV